MATLQAPLTSARHEHGHRQLSAAAWGLIFIWIGVATLLQVGWGYGLIGFGLISLGSQFAHLMLGDYKFDVFGTMIGVVFLLGGVWILFGIQAGLVSVLCIVAGVALLISALTSRPAR